MSISPYIQTIRKSVGSALLIMPGVSMACFDDQNRLLLADHGGKKGWAIPGGSVEPDDLPAGTAVREMWEEASLQVEPIRIMGVYGGKNFLTEHPNGDLVDYKDTVIACRIVGGEMQPDLEEITRLGFFSPAEMVEMTLPAWMHEILPQIYSQNEPTFFQPPTWQPPADGIRKGGMSAYVRDLRARIGHQQLIMPACAAIVRDDQRRILMQRRSDNGLWTLPGGAIDPYESPVDAVLREIWEETGVVAKPIRVAGVFSGPESHFSYPHGDQVAVYSFVFECQAHTGEPTTDDNESLEVGYFPLDEALALPMSARWRRRIPLLVQGGGQGAYFDLPAPTYFP